MKRFWSFILFCIYHPVKKRTRAFLWPKKEIILNQGKQYRCRDMMTLSKIVWGFRKLGQREPCSCWTLTYRYIVNETNSSIWAQVGNLYRTLIKVQVTVIFNQLDSDAIMLMLIWFCKLSVIFLLAKQIFLVLFISFCWWYFFLFS